MTPATPSPSRQDRRSQEGLRLQGINTRGGQVTNESERGDIRVLTAKYDGGGGPHDAKEGGVDGVFRAHGGGGVWWSLVE